MPKSAAPKALREMKVYAPGKLILSGEHAVVYGQPALAVAVNRYVTATITPESRRQILFDLADMAHQRHLSLDGLRQLKNRVKRKYQRFVQGEYSIRDVLQKPFELAQFALGLFAESFNLTLPHGVKIQVQSDIPIGCGMGSSAATILSVMHAVSLYLNMQLSQDTLFRVALEAENMQHGYSSGLDLRVALHGGCIYLSDQCIERRDLPTVPLFLINTGAPQTTTGQCVEKVASHFKSTQLGDEFGAVTRALDAAFQAKTITGVLQAISANHQLLVSIGVVPTSIQRFIAGIEALGGAAKICGAGAIAGEQGGMVLAVIEDSAALAAWCARFGYTAEPVSVDMRGVHAV